MKKSKRYNTTLGKLFFIIPIVIIGLLVVYAYVELNSPGTLIVTAEYASCVDATTSTTSGCQLHVAATVNGKSGETPWTISLVQGTYAVNFTSLQWYYPPASRDVAVTPGLTTYAVAVYKPVGRVILVTESGFNATTVTALHGVTPVNWTNPGATVVTFEGTPFGNVPLEPGQTLSYTFSTAGVYKYTVLSTSYNVTIDVS